MTADEKDKRRDRKDTLITPKEAARELRVAVATLAKWRASRQGPPFIRLIGRIRYRRGDLRDWLNDQTVKHNQE